MSGTDDAVLLLAFRGGDNSQAVLDQLLQFADEGSGSHFVNNFVASLRLEFPDIESALERAMKRLEQLGEINEALACVLMASLSSIASRVIGLHDIRDGTELWIFGCHAPALRGYLVKLSAFEPDEDNFNGLIAMLDERDAKCAATAMPPFPPAE